jgi:small subunit ribosomal protein S8
MVIDTISNLIISLKNAQKAKHAQVVISYSKLKHAILDTLKKEGFIADVEKTGKDISKKLVITLKYEEDGSPVISEVKRNSKQSKRIYTGYKDIKQVRNGYGISILSTPQGVMSNKQATKAKVGGELLFTMW